MRVQRLLPVLVGRNHQIPQVGFPRPTVENLNRDFLVHTLLVLSIGAIRRHLRRLKPLDRLLDRRPIADQDIPVSPPPAQLFQDRRAVMRKEVVPDGHPSRRR